MMATPTEPLPKRKRRWLRLSVRALLFADGFTGLDRSTRRA
jgi:hypothetical protein